MMSFGERRIFTSRQQEVKQESPAWQLKEKVSLGWSGSLVSFMRNSFA
jgi:hypothetical protein